MSVPKVCDPPCPERMEAMADGSFVRYTIGGPLGSIRRYYVDLSLPLLKNGTRVKWEVGHSACPWCARDLVEEQAKEDSYR